MTWYDALKSCQQFHGTPVTNTSTYLELTRNLQTDNISIWTGEHTYKPNNGDCHSNKAMKVCGYIYVHEYESTGIYKFDQEIKYGQCDVDRLYLCKSNCVVPVTDFNNLCKAYDNKVGSYYVNCTSQRYMICDFENGTVLPKGYRYLSTVRETVLPHSETSSYTGRGTGYMSTLHTFNANNGVSEQQNENDLGLKVGVSVAVCVVLLIAVTIVVICCRRYRRHKNATTGNNSANGQMPPTSNNMQLQSRNSPDGDFVGSRQSNNIQPRNITNGTSNLSNDGNVSGQLPNNIQPRSVTNENSKLSNDGYVSGQLPNNIQPRSVTNNLSNDGNVSGRLSNNIQPRSVTNGSSNLSNDGNVSGRLSNNIQPSSITNGTSNLSNDGNVSGRLPNNIQPRSVTNENSKLSNDGYVSGRLSNNL
ncbi:hypothetical protein ACF0H5_009802 [Mactra antiquata]